jgi:hypothetical protein
MKFTEWLAANHPPYMQKDEGNVRPLFTWKALKAAYEAGYEEHRALCSDAFREPGPCVCGHAGGFRTHPANGCPFGPYIELADSPPAQGSES